MQRRPSIVRNVGANQASCGYCKSCDSMSSYGMFINKMDVGDYQNLVDRGWRRCGSFCYKPINETTCCPMYTIKCEALKFKLSKSQKKVIKKVSSSILHSKNENSGAGSEAGCPTKVSDKPVSQSVTKSKKDVKPGVGIDLSKPRCHKSKVKKQMKLEMKKSHEKESPTTLTSSTNSDKVNKYNTKCTEKSLEDYINESQAQSDALELRLVPAKSSPEILALSFQIYKKYQIEVHKELEQECTYSSFYEFLVYSPLETNDHSEEPECGYGTFHHQYWLNNKLIAVGVLDILPKCVSSVYFFYDPSYSYLTLGTYGSLREIELVRNLAKTNPNLNLYYLGFYIHSCPKMRYKSHIKPSYLLCPEAYTWHPINECLPKLDKNKYSRFNDDPNVKCDESDCTKAINELRLYADKMTTFLHYKSECDEEDIEDIKQFASLIGKTTLKNIVLCIN